MGWFIAIVVVVYLVMTVYWAKRYFLRRHGVVATQGDRGTSRAGTVGMLWPITIWLRAVREPELCSHPKHVLARDRIRRQIQQVEEIRRQEHG